MKYYAEVHPRITANISFLRGLSQYDGFNIPDSPMGSPAPSPLAAACLIRRVYEDKEIVINQRLLDVNELHLISIAQGASMLNLSIALTRGDEPKVGKAVGYLTSEEALKVIKGAVKGIKVGLMVSLRYPKESIKARLSLGADFYLVLRMGSVDDLDGLDASRLIPYVLVATDRNRGILRRINQPYFELRDLGQVFARLREKGVLGVIVSAPGDHEALVSAVRYFA